MRRHAKGLGILVLVFLVVPASAAGKKHKKTTEAATVQDYQLLLQSGTAIGRLSALDDNPKTVTLQVDVPSVELKTRAGQGKNQAQALARRQQELQREQLKVMHSRTAAELAKNLQQLSSRLQRQQLAHGGQPGSALRVATQTREFTLPLTDDVKVRLEELPERSNEKGQPQPYTKSERQERKSPNPNLPGYSADLDSLHTGQTIMIYVRKKQAKPAPKASADETKPAEEKPQVRMIVILKEAPTSTADQQKK